MESSSNISNISSLEALNGSADSYQHPHVNTANARYPTGISQGGTASNYYHSVNGNHRLEGVHYGNEPGHHSSASDPHTTTTYDISPTTTYSTELDYENLPSVDDAYYPSGTTPYPQTTYATTISIGDEQNGTDAGGYPRLGYTGAGQVPNQGYYAQHKVQTTNQEHSLSMRRWSLENAPEERIRVGLPRWESEQHRVAYEKGNMHIPSNMNEQSDRQEYSSDQGHSRRQDEKRNTRQRSRMREHHR